MSQEIQLKRFDPWLDDNGPAALVCIEYLQPVTEVVGTEEKGRSPVFPPTYAPEQGSSSRKSEYVIDMLRDGRNVCQIDSVGSQSNRLEPIFKNPPYDALVPQVTVEVAGGQKVNLLDAGHRAADAIVRFSSLHTQLKDGFEAWLKGDASKLAVVAPTSLLFGAWDSRGTQAKAPRIISSVIRAYDVEPLSRSAQYIPPVDYTPEVLGESATLTDEQKSEFGLTHVPAPRALGGVLVRGEIQREAILNLVSLRALGVPDEKGELDKDKTSVLRRYMLALGLVALTKPQVHNLRQGCLLVGIEEKPVSWRLVHASGKREEFAYTHEEALAFAKEAKKTFISSFAAEKNEVGGFAPVTARFEPELAKKAATQKAAQKQTKRDSKKRGNATAA